MVWPLVSSALRRCSGPQLQLCRWAASNAQNAEPTGYGPISLDATYREFYHTLEEKWQKQWKEDSLAGKQLRSVKPYTSAKKKSYVLSMFPYPSGRLHLGHVRVYAISHTLAAYRRMLGYEVIHPMGWDSFGLPAENAAIDRGIAPHVWTESNIADMKEQLEGVGLHFDWHREIATHRPDYYKWTQWLFLKLYENNLAYQTAAFVNWDPVDQTVLANEQVDSEGRAWRSGAMAERRELRQWFVRTSAYSQELYDGLNELEWPPAVKKLQKKWINPSAGTVFKFKLAEAVADEECIEIYTTLPRDVFGVSFVALSRSHPLVHKHINNLPAEHRQKVREFCTAVNAERTGGADTGLTVVNPFTGQRLPVYVAGYVHEGYATGAVMSVPLQNEVDRAFAEEFGIAIVAGSLDGKLINAGQFDGLTAKCVDTDAAISNYAMEQGFGYAAKFTRLRDWLVSRQRYWGTPIPVIHCSKCPEPVPVPDDQLPVVLPPDVTLEGRGGSPLAKLDDWVNVSCPACGSPAKRDTDTMDTFMDSAWYFLRYADPRNSKELIMKESAMEKGTQSLLPVDTYVGGIEHAILHLLYARFIHRFVSSLGLVTSKEPFRHLITQGIVKGKTFKSPGDGRFLKPEEVDVDGDMGVEKSTGLPAIMEWEKMSKSKHNGIDPMDLMSRFGADTIRMYLLGDAPSSQPFKWQEGGIIGFNRLLGRMWAMTKEYGDALEKCRAAGDTLDEDNLDEKHLAAVTTLEKAFHTCIGKASKSFDTQVFTTAIITLFIMSDKLSAAVQHPQLCTTPFLRHCFESHVIMFWPLAPHIAEELWQALEGIHGTENPLRVWQQAWPVVEDFEMFAVDHWTVRVVGDSKLKRFTAPVKVRNDEQHVCQIALDRDDVIAAIGNRKVTSVATKKQFMTIELETEAE